MPYVSYPAYKSTHTADFLSGRSLIEAGANAAIVGGLDATTAFARVAWLSRGVKLRARHVARFPHELMLHGREAPDAPEFAEFNRRKGGLLYRAEASICLTGAGYWLLDTNDSGYNLTPRWVLSGSMQPVVDRVQGLTGFKRDNKPVELDRVVYFWEPSFTSEVAPGVGCGETALAAASQLYAMDAFLAQYFNQGAVKVTIFPIPLGTPDTERDRLQNFLNRRVSGVLNAFKMIVIRLIDKLVPIVIGSDVKDTQAPDLITLKRDDVAAALDTPPSVIDGTSANFATATSDYFGFIVGTIIPRVEWLYEIINAQYLNRLDAEIVARPEKLEVMQTAQLEQAKALTALTDEPILTVNEARGYLELGPKPKAPEPPPLPALPPGILPQAMLPAPPGPAASISATLAKWRKTHLDATARGVYYSGQPFKAALPAEMYETLAGELMQATGARDVRAVFERHWPDRHGGELDESALLALATEVRAARRALEAG